MTGSKHRPPVSDRARRRAIRAHAALLGVPYSVAARLLTVHTQGTRAPGPRSRDGRGWNEPAEHRAWVFAMRERRRFELRVRDTRLAVDLPLGRAAHLAERFPALRQPPAGPLYGGEARQATLGMLYAVVAHESPALLPSAEELSWVAELGEEAAVDIVCAGPDRAARLLLDDDRWQLLTRIDAALSAGEAAQDRRVRDAAITLGRVFRTTVLRRSLEGARHTLDALLVAAHDGHAPGTRVRILAGPHGDGDATIGDATIVGVQWPESGPPHAYAIRVDQGRSVVIAGVDDFAILDQPSDRGPSDRGPDAKRPAPAQN
jgi:hypothetical protein